MAIPPRILSLNFIYTTPKAEYFANHAKFVNTIIKDWQIGGFQNLQSGPFLGAPASPNAEFLPTFDVYNKGVPLYLNPKTGQPTNTSPVNSNYNPWTDVLLNPAAWSSCPTNTTCGDNNDYSILKSFRGRRMPSQNANIGRNFRIKERMNLQVRAEFVNIFNRDLAYVNPSLASPLNPVTRNSSGILTGGFGTAAVYNPPNTPASTTTDGRTGTMIARFSF